MDVTVTDLEWVFIRKQLSKLPQKKSWHGRMRAEDRQIFEALLWLLATGSRWRDIPIERYPAKSSCYRRFQIWAQDGSLRRLHRALVNKLHHMKKLNLQEGFVDGTEIKAKKGALMSGTSAKAKDLGLWLSLKEMVCLLEWMSSPPIEMKPNSWSLPLSIRLRVYQNQKTSWGTSSSVHKN